MSGYEVGDWVLIRAQVTDVYGSDIGYSVELFSKTDQYRAMVRADLIEGKATTPHPDEPDHDALLRDSESDIWHWSGSGWRIGRVGPGKPWDDMADYGPYEVFEATS